VIYLFSGLVLAVGVWFAREAQIYAGASGWTQSRIETYELPLQDGVVRLSRLDKRGVACQAVALTCAFVAGIVL